MPSVQSTCAQVTSWLIGIRSADQLTTHPLRSSLFETFIIGELIKSRFNQGKKVDLFFWRDSNGNDVDIIAEQSGRLVPLQIKSGKTISSDSTKGLKKYMSLAVQDAITPTLIYGGSDNYNKQDIHITSWKKSGTILKGDRCEE
ncbi:MAG TPA: DUF4143 domain-containing protein [Desulfocapsa sulfexigens]|nr:DUF4143 domain-containing protein [Desulfocapsa sulfexigens]